MSTENHRPDMDYWKKRHDFIRGNKNEKKIGMEDAAKELGISVSSLYRWLREDDTIPCMRSGRQWRFFRSELEAWQSDKAQKLRERRKARREKRENATVPST